jgi:two-component system chemotaxis response regulator CheB
MGACGAWSPRNRHRPAIDVLFRSAAKTYGPRVIGLVLTGFLNDGTAGLLAIQDAGGVTVVQDPQDAEFSSMPASAVEHVRVNYCLPLAAIPSLLIQLVRGAAVPKQSVPRKKTRVKQMRPSVYTCPECHGTLWEIDEDEVLRFRCRVGHSYTAETMLEDQTDSLERALWAAVRGLEERADIARRIAIRMRSQNRPLAARRFEKKAEAARDGARTIQALLTNGKAGTATDQSPASVA